MTLSRSFYERSMSQSGVLCVIGEEEIKNDLVAILLWTVDGSVRRSLCDRRGRNKEWPCRDPSMNGRWVSRMNSLAHILYEPIFSTSALDDGIVKTRVVQEMHACIEVSCPIYGSAYALFIKQVWTNCINSLASMHHCIFDAMNARMCDLVFQCLDIIPLKSVLWLSTEMI